MKIKNIGQRIFICKEGEIPPSSEKDISVEEAKILIASFPNDFEVIKEEIKESKRSSKQK